MPSYKPVNNYIIPGKSIVPLLSASTSLIMSCSSDSEGFWPRERITVPSSLVVIWPIRFYQYMLVKKTFVRDKYRRVRGGLTISILVLLIKTASQLTIHHNIATTRFPNLQKERKPPYTRRLAPQSKNQPAKQHRISKPTSERLSRSSGLGLPRSVGDTQGGRDDRADRNELPWRGTYHGVRLW
jgi:hypothetical protein